MISSRSIFSHGGKKKEETEESLHDILTGGPGQVLTKDSVRMRTSEPVSSWICLQDSFSSSCLVTLLWTSSYRLRAKSDRETY